MPSGFGFTHTLEAEAVAPAWVPGGGGGAAPRAGRTMGADARKVTETSHPNQPHV